MVWKITLNVGGSSTKFGGQDLTKVSNLFGGDTDVDSCDINSPFYLRSGKTFFKHDNGFTLSHIVATLAAHIQVLWPALTADDEPLFKSFPAELSGKTIAHGSNGNVLSGINDSAIAAHTSTKITITNRTHLPSLAAYLDTLQVWTAVQKMDKELKLRPVPAPSTDPDYGILYPDSGNSNKLTYRDPAGNVTVLGGGGGGGGGAPTTESYVVLSSSGVLTNERILAEGSGVSITDGGPDGNVTIKAKQRLLTRISTEQDVVNTTTETDILNYSVPGNTLGTVKALRVTILADYLNNSGSNRTFTLKIKYGGTTMYSSATPNLSASATRRVGRFEFILFAKNVNNSQGMIGHAKLGDTSAATTGLGDLSGGSAFSQDIAGVNASEDSTQTKTLSVTITHSTNLTTVSFRRLYAVVELLD